MALCVVMGYPLFGWCGNGHYLSQVLRHIAGVMRTGPGSTNQPIKSVRCAAKNFFGAAYAFQKLSQFLIFAFSFKHFFRARTFLFRNETWCFVRPLFPGALVAPAFCACTVSPLIFWQGSSGGKKRC